MTSKPITQAQLNKIKKQKLIKLLKDIRSIGLRPDTIWAETFNVSLEGMMRLRVYRYSHPTSEGILLFLAKLTEILDSCLAGKVKQEFILKDQPLKHCVIKAPRSYQNPECVRQMKQKIYELITWFEQN